MTVRLAGKGGVTPAAVTSVYVHAPFCSRRCVYCDFAVTVRATGDVDAWVDALDREMRSVETERLFHLEDRLRTLYVGGGTPSLLGPGAMGRLRDLFGHDRLSDPDLEWTAEANPESLTPEVAGGWAGAGVNRLSIGAQTFSEAALRWMGRLHGSDGPGRAVDRARSVGITNLSVDLIFGLPASVERSWTDDLARALALDVPHVSLYGLTVEPGTALGRAVEGGRVHPVDDERYREEYLEAAETLTGAGYRHYEVSSFARPDRESRHNAVYWTGEAYLGLGNGAHSYAPPVRRWNIRAFEGYREALVEGRSPEEARERVSGGSAALERRWLALRTDQGIPVPPEGSGAADVVAGWCARGWAETIDTRLRLTAEGWLLLDRLTVELDEAAGPPTEPPATDGQAASG